MGADSANKQYGAGVDLFGRDASAYASTGAPGSVGVTPEMTAGPVVGSPRVLMSPYSSSQVPENLPTVEVTAGDTCASAADAPIPGTDPLTGLGMDFIAATGAGLGTVPDRHPGGRP